MRKQIIMGLFVLATIGFTGCSNPLPTSKNTPISTMVKTDPLHSSPITSPTPMPTPSPTPMLNTNPVRSLPLTDNEAKDILNQIIPRAVNIYGMFNGPATGYFKVDATKSIPGEGKYGLVTGVKGNPITDTNNVKSIADLKKGIETVFTKDAAQKLFYSRYLETAENKDLPLYKDYEGQLYVDTQNGGHGWARKFLYDTAKIKSQRDNVIEITLDATSYDDPEGTLIVTLEYVNGKWLMASGLDDYEITITGAVTGYVTKIENQKALIVSPISRKRNETIKEYYDAYWVSNMPSNLQVGQYVHAWFENEKATDQTAIYPGQGRAAKIAISDAPKPQKAILSPDEVIRKAVLTKDMTNINILVIKDVTYDEKSSIWTIQFKSASRTDTPTEVQTIQIPDK